MLDLITPLILTYNEEPNLRRTLQRLAWAKSIVVMDSFSTDATLQIAAEFPNVRVLQRKFDTFAEQINYALDHAQLAGDWVLTLDADYVLSDELVAELATLAPPADVAGYRCAFRYCVQGAPLRASLYPPSVVLFRRQAGRYHNDGHAYRLTLAQGSVLPLNGRIDHDDRKPFSRWMASQVSYARQEAEKLSAASWSELPWQDRARKVPFLAPVLVLPYCLIVKRCALDGRAGLTYAAQRTIAECVLSFSLLRRAK